MSDIKKSLKPTKTVVKCGHNTIENIFNKLVKQRTKSEKIPTTSVVKKKSSKKSICVFHNWNICI